MKMGKAFSLFHFPKNTIPVDTPKKAMPDKNKYNPFLEDPVIRVMLEEADGATLKTLREMNDNWNQLDIKELTKRAAQGQMKTVSIMRACQDSITRFMEDTCGNPQLFRSFCFFPKSLKDLDLSFFSKYHPIDLTLYIYDNFKFTDDAYNYWLNILSLVAPHIQGFNIIIIRSFGGGWKSEVVRALPMVIQPVFPKLTQLACSNQLSTVGDWWNQLTKPLLEKSQEVDPTPVLTNLQISSNIEHLDVLKLTPAAIPRWVQLTDLNIKLDGNLGNSKRIMAALLTMARKGLALKAFSVTIFTTSTNDWNGITENLSCLLDTQAKSLLTLTFIISFRTLPPRDITITKIKLPIFERVHSFKIIIESFKGPADTSMFEMGQLPVHFPKLENLKVDHDLLPTLYSDGAPAKSLPLKSLCISLNLYYHETASYDQFVQDFDFNAWKEWLRTKFESVEAFECFGSVLGIDGAELPWKETLKELTITDVNAPIKVSYLTNLRKLSVISYDFEEDYVGNPAGFLAFFQDVLSLPLSSITFTLFSDIPEEVEEMFASHFPFPVKFN